jgi:hypothetical protein
MGALDVHGASACSQRLEGTPPIEEWGSEGADDEDKEEASLAWACRKD